MGCRIFLEENLTFSTSSSAVELRPEGTLGHVAPSLSNLSIRRWKAFGRGTPLGFLGQNCWRKDLLTKAVLSSSENFVTTQLVCSLVYGEFA